MTPAGVCERKTTVNKRGIETLDFGDFRGGLVT